MPKARQPIEVAAPPRRVPLAFLLVILGTLVAFAPALRGPEVFDDPESISANPTITTLWPPTVPLKPPPLSSMSGRPIANYTLAVNYAVNTAMGINQTATSDDPDRTLSYHLVNILLHVLSGLLLFGIIRRTLRLGRFEARWSRDADHVAMLVAAVWLLHPIQTQAVDYLTQRTELMVSLCYLGTIYASIRAWDAASGARTRWYATGILACLLGMGSKEVMVSAPLMVVLYDRAFRLDSWRAFRAPDMKSRRWYYAGLFATLGVLLVLMAPGPRSASVGFHVGPSWSEYLVSQGWAIPHYLLLVLWPAQLTFDYGARALPLSQGLPGLILLGVLGVLTVLAWTRVPRWGWLAFCGAWFFCILAPSSSVVTLSGDIAAERRIYLALAAVVVVLYVGLDRGASMLSQPKYRSTGAGKLWAWLSHDPRAGRWGAIALLSLLALFTFQRSRLYADPVALWRDAVEKRPDNSRAKSNLGGLLASLPVPRTEEASELFKAATEEDSTYATAWYNYATSEIQLGRPAEAERALRRFVAISPTDRRGLMYLGNLMLNRGDAAGAVPFFQRAVDSLADGPALVSLGAALMSAGRDSAAVATFERAIRLDPARYDAMRYLGGMLLERGHADQALPWLERATNQDRSTSLNSALLALAYAQVHRVPDAVTAADHAVQLGVSDYPTQFYAGRAMYEAGKYDLAEAYFTRAMQLQAKNPDVLTALGNTSEKLGRRTEALELFRRALELNPQDAGAQAGLKRLGGK